MLHTLMLLGLGFLTASLIAFLLAPFLWRYAVHATKQHIRKTSPLTMGEIRSDRDQLRAEHALTQRKLELERDRLDEDNKIHQIEIAELKKNLREIARDISSHGAEIKTKDSLLSEIAEERDKLKSLLQNKETDLKEAQRSTRKEKALSARSATALKETNAQLKTRETELKNLRKSIEKNNNQKDTAIKKLAIMEDHIVRLNTCNRAVKNVNNELLSLEKECEKFLRSHFSTKKEFTAKQKKLLKSLSGLVTLEKSVRKQWSIASKAEGGGRALFAPLKTQLDHVKGSMSVIKRIIEKAGYKEGNPVSKKSAPKPKKHEEEDLSKRIRSLQDKLSA